MTRERADAFLAVGSPLFSSERMLLAELALEHRLPGMFANRANVEAGGLMSYGPDLDDLIRRATVYIDKILKGAKPADLPWSRLPNLSSQSISGPPRRSGLPCRRCSSSAPTK